MTNICVSNSCSLTRAHVAHVAPRYASVRSTRARASRAVRVQASMSDIKPPAGVTLPPKLPETPPAMFGFVDWAEKINSRFAMMGFFALLAVEGFTGQPFLDTIGIATGSGLHFEL